MLHRCGCAIPLAQALLYPSADKAPQRPTEGYEASGLPTKTGRESTSPRTMHPSSRITIRTPPRPKQATLKPRLPRGFFCGARMGAGVRACRSGQLAAPGPPRRGRPSRSAALRLAAIQARHAAIHHDDGRGAALGAQLGAFREVRLGERVRLLGARLELRALLVDQLLLVLIELRACAGGRWSAGASRSRSRARQ